MQNVDIIQAMPYAKVLRLTRNIMLMEVDIQLLFVFGLLKLC